MVGDFFRILFFLFDVINDSFIFFLTGFDLLVFPRLINFTAPNSLILLKRNYSAAFYLAIFAKFLGRSIEKNIGSGVWSVITNLVNHFAAINLSFVGVTNTECSENLIRAIKLNMDCVFLVILNRKYVLRISFEWDWWLWVVSNYESPSVMHYLLYSESFFCLFNANFFPHTLEFFKFHVFSL